jgi:hypothetical protein
MLLHHKIGWNKNPGYDVSNHTPSKVQQKMSKSWGDSKILQEIDLNQQLMSGDSCLSWLLCTHIRIMGQRRLQNIVT